MEQIGIDSACGSGGFLIQAFNYVNAKINLIMHGDGWNNIYQGDTLNSDKLPDDYFDVVLANPPFTIPYSFKDVLQKYELGFDKESEELDILFVEKSLNV